MVLCPTQTNQTQHADIWSKGSLLNKIRDIWIEENNKWPDKPKSKKFEGKAKIILETKVKQKDFFELHKILILSAWASYNFRNKCQERFYIQLEQRKVKHSEKFEQSRKQLNLQLNCECIYQCRGRIQGVYPIYLPPSPPLSEKMIMSSHSKNLHGWVASTMAEIRSLFWIPVLTKLRKSIAPNCHGCKRLRAMHYPNLKPSLLPRDRTEQAFPFETVGTDCASPLY